MEPLKVNDRVRLVATTTPIMYIARIDGNTADCFWQHASGKKSDNYPLACLELVPPAAPAASFKKVWTL